MNVPPLQNSSLSSPVSSPSKNLDFSSPPDGSIDKLADNVALSDSSRQLLKEFLQSKTPPVFVAIPAGQRPAPQQSADTILGFIDQQLEKRAAEGASREELKSVLEQGVKGFNRGFIDALKTIEKLGLMTEEVRSSIFDTKSLVLTGLDALREQYLAIPNNAGKGNVEPVDKPQTVVTQVNAFRRESRVESSAVVANVNNLAANNTPSSIRTAAVSYAESYKRNESVELLVKTRDGDTVNLSFSSNFSSSNSLAAFLGNTPQAALSGQSYQSNVNASANFSFSVRGELDEGEIASLNTLFAQIAELADEFFNGDFDAALSLASQFELDTDEFSALSLDIARSTSTSVVQSYAASESSIASQGTQLLPDSGLEAIANVLEQLQQALETARSFNDPKSLLTDLLANQLTQKSLTLSGFDVGTVASLLDGLLEELT